MSNRKFRVNSYVKSPVSENIFKVIKYYEDDGILFGCTNSHVSNHKFKLKKELYKNFVAVDTGDWKDCKNIWW